ncbi:MarR family winged helix-turn-helix transcriptional regulator [Deinococcus hohokamensis]|uniref:MarR family winged helix-turn-helix transcriptional regulator n=1 Tax=Deinococcus hohokamensis TaxID=309883 RepID=A0ABV9IC87_9DEIO
MTSPDPLPMAFVQAFWDLWQTLAAQVGAELERRHGLDLRAFITLAYVQGAEPGADQPAALARLTGVPRYEMSRILARLEAAGAVTRQGAAPDARRVTVQATPQGRALYAAAEQTVLGLVTPLLAGLGEPATLDLTTRLRALAGAARTAKETP